MMRMMMTVVMQGIVMVSSKRRPYAERERSSKRKQGMMYLCEVIRK